MSKQIDYCCLKNIRVEWGHPFYKMMLKGDSYLSYREDYNDWLITGSPAALVGNYPATYAYTDCDECRHKLVCLVNKEATVTFERHQ